MISIIIVAYNSKKHLSKCIHHINNQFNSLNKYEIIIINNQINDTYNIPKQNNINITNNLNNVGFSKAVNQGVKLCHGETLMFVNPDTYLENKCIENLYNTLSSNKNIGIVGAKLLNRNKTHQGSSMRRFPHIFISIIYFFKLYKIGIKNYYNYQDYNLNTINSVYSVSGACMMIRKKDFLDVGGFNENYFLYFEDTDLCQRIKNNNLLTIYNPNAKAIHLKGQSIKSYNKLYIKLIFSISLLKFFIQHIKEYKLFLANIVVILLYIFYYNY